MMRKILLGFALVSVFCFAAYLRYHHAKPPLGVAYAGNHQVTLWSTTAQVREPVVTVNYGDRLDVLQRFEEEVKVRTASGFTGWVSEKELLPEDLWEKAKELNARAAALPVEARGHTRVLSNLHIEPGRDTPRLRQLNKQVPVDLFERDVEEVPTTARATGEEDDSGAETATAKKKTGGWCSRTRPATRRWRAGCWAGLSISTFRSRCRITPVRRTCGSWRGSS